MTRLEKKHPPDEGDNFMRRWLLLGTLTFLLTAALCAVQAVQDSQPVAMKIKAPELRDVEEWINTKPLQLKDLRGKVVVLHFWTFG
jgi:hypothetical protein